MRFITNLVAINETLKEEMKRDKRVFLIGEDLSYPVFGVTEGIKKQFKKRVIDTPICENGILGAAIGASMLGLKPVVEIMFEDFLMGCMDPIINQLIKLYLTDKFKHLCVVIRTPGGAGLSLSYQHSQSLESMFIHIPGIVLVTPSNPYDIKGLLRTAIRGNRPVIFFEHKLLYFEGGRCTNNDYTIPFGKARIIKKGKHITVVALLGMVKKVIKSAEILEKQGINVEIIDPRTLVPLDIETINNSVRKTKRLVIVEESTGGIGAEISAKVYEKCFRYLKFPVKRVSGSYGLIPFNSKLERRMIPDENKIIKAIKMVL